MLSVCEAIFSHFVACFVCLCRTISTNWQLHKSTATKEWMKSSARLSIETKIERKRNELDVIWMGLMISPLYFIIIMNKKKKQKKKYFHAQSSLAYYANIRGYIKNKEPFILLALFDTLLFSNQIFRFLVILLLFCLQKIAENCVHNPSALNTCAMCEHNKNLNEKKNNWMRTTLWHIYIHRLAKWLLMKKEKKIQEEWKKAEGCCATQWTMKRKKKFFWHSFRAPFVISHSYIPPVPSFFSILLLA